MKLSFRLFVVLLIPLLAISRPALPRQYAEYEAYWYPDDVYGGDSAVDPLYEPYVDQYRGFGATENPYPGQELSDWNYDPYRFDSDRAGGSHPYSRRIPGDGNRHYPLSGEWMGFRRSPDIVPPDLPGYGYVEQAPLREQKPYVTASQFRFRGDAPVGLGRSDGRDWRQGYRFRPLTAQERQRMAADTGWRPRDPNWRGERFHPVDRMPSEEAYGYQPDSWFHRYDQVQP